MKRLFTSVLILTLVFSLCGCGETKSPPQTETSVDTMTETTTEITTESTTVTETETAESTAERVVHELEDISETKENVFSCTYDGIKHDFILCLPEVTENAPLVVMLHGQGGNPQSFKTEIAFETTANPAGYAVCYVSGAANPNVKPHVPGWNCEEFDNANDDVGFLIALAKYLKTEYNFDGNRIYAAGFSRGASMLHALAMEADSTYSGFVSVAGIMQENVWKKANTDNDISFFQITGEKDQLVPKNSDGSIKNTSGPAIEDVMEYWVSSNGLSLSATDKIGVNSESILNKYTSGGKKTQVWDLFVKNCLHSWPSPSTHKIDTNSLIIEFFESIK